MRARVRLWRAFVGARIRAQWQYRTSFAIDVVMSFVLTFLDFVAILVIFTHLHALGHWSVHDVAFLYGTSGIAFAITDVFVSNLETTGQLVRTGQFDVMLIRPAGTLLQVVAGDVALRAVGNATQASVVLVYAIAGASIAWSAPKVAMTLVIVVCGVLIYSSAFVAGSCVAFATVGAYEATNAVTYGGAFFSQYPLDIFGPWLRRFIGYLVPTAFVAYFPALYVLGKPMPFGLPGWLRFVSPLVAAAALAIAITCWNACVRGYRSTGS